MKDDVAGDPISGLRWTKKSSDKIAQELFDGYGIHVCPNTVCALLRDIGYSLRINHKKFEYNKILTKEQRKQRNEQFLYIKSQRIHFQKNKYGIISIDAKKKEYIGNFKNSGKSWRQQQKNVNAYDFPSWAIGVGISFGIFDTTLNQGTVIVGTSYNTPEFAIDALSQWWEMTGYKHYEKNKKLLILADGGGSNGWRSRYWKWGLQHKICNIYGIEVSLSHYPTGTSKYNPIEHKLFCHISKNWEAQPLTSYETMLKYIATTTTKTGLSVEAVLNDIQYEKGLKITDKELSELNIVKHSVIPKWNYTIKPY